MTKSPRQTATKQSPKKEANKVSTLEMAKTREKRPGKPCRRCGVLVRDHTRRHMERHHETEHVSGGTFEVLKPGEEPDMPRKKAKGGGSRADNVNQGFQKGNLMWQKSDSFRRGLDRDMKQINKVTGDWDMLPSEEELDKDGSRTYGELRKGSLESVLKTI
jgi:hypothetical protein